MKIKNLKIAGIDYRVLYEDTLEHDGSTNYMGLVDHSYQTILVSNYLGEQRQQQVLMHEALHAIFHEAGYHEHEEDMIVRLAPVLYQFIKDNFKYKEKHDEDNQ